MEEERTTPLTAGSKLGPYLILSPLGVGGMGLVYRAKDTKLNREVALKVLPNILAEDAAAVARFEREARAAAALSHPNILAMYDFGRIEGRTFAVMELLEGETLRERLSGGPLPQRKATEIAIEVTEGLAAAHAKGIVHRDLKPENIFITHAGRVKILDFGLASVESQEACDDDSATRSRHTASGHVLGTAGYMSPEQVRAQTADARSDIFSLGAVLYELLTGQRAFLGPSAVEAMSATLNLEPTQMSSSGRMVPADLQMIVRHCLEKKPSERFQSAHDLKLALSATLANSSAAVGSPPARREPPSPGRRLLIAAGVVILGLTSLAGHSWLARRSASGSHLPLSFHDLTYSGRDTSPAASPDGRMVAFCSDQDGVRRIWLKQLEGEGEAAITDGPDDFPRFSPDGSQILFVRTEGSRTSLFRAPVVPGEARRVVADAAEGDWSPDGRTIAFVRDHPTEVKGHLGTVDATGSEERILATVEHRLRKPRWSPNGRTIATLPGEGRVAGTPRFVLLVSADGGERRSLSAPDPYRDVSSVAWVNDMEILYSQAESVVDAPGGAARVFRQNIHTGQVLSNSWSPNSSRVVDLLGAGRLVLDARSPRQNLRAIPIADGTGGRDRWLTRGNSPDRQPAFSRDGDRIVFSSYRRGRLDIWELPIHGGVSRGLTDDDASDWDPALTPSGKLLWSSDRSGHFEIWMAEADGTGGRRVTNDGADAENPTITPDEQWITYVSGNPDKSGIWKIHPDGSGAARLVPGKLLLPEVSPDGRYVLYLENPGPGVYPLRVAQVSDGSDTGFEILVDLRKSKNLNSNILGRARWMPDGRAIAFLGLDERGSNGIFVQDFAPGRDTHATRRPLGGFDPEAAAESFSIAPDGKDMVVSSWIQLFTIVEAVGFPELLPSRNRRR